MRVYDHYSQTSFLRIEFKFYEAHPWERGACMYQFGLGHMTKMAAMPIYVKNL